MLNGGTHYGTTESGADLAAMAELTRQGRYDRLTETLRELTGEAPMNMRDFVKLHAAEFK